MTRAKHPKKEVEAALRYAESQGWRVEMAEGERARLGSFLLPPQ